MKKSILLISLLPLLLVSCNNETKPNPEQFVNMVANTSSIACRRYNRRSEVLIGSDPTYIYRPSTFKRDEHKDWPYIYATNLALDVWFEYSEDSPYRAEIEWTFSRPELVNYRLPSSEVTSRANMTFKDEAFPDNYVDEIDCFLTGVITFESASATVTYEIIFKTLPDGASTK